MFSCRGSRPAEGPHLAEALHELVDACLAGDEMAARQFVERFGQRVFGLCWRMLGHRQDAEDATQETFVRALGGLGGWDRQRPIEPWLLTIAANRCRTALAGRRRRPAVQPLPAEAIVAGDDLQAARQLAEEIRRALDAMPSQYALAFRLFHDQELSYAEIAETCGRPLGTIKTWVHRARRRVVELLLARGVIEGHVDGLRPDRTATQQIAG